MLNELCFNFPAYKEKVNSNPNGSLGPETHQKAPGSRWAPHPRSLPVWATSHPIVPVFEKMSCRMRGRRVTIPEPRGRKSLWEGERVRNYSRGQLAGGAGSVATWSGAIPSCNLGDLSKDTNPSRVPGNALALEGLEATEELGRGWIGG